MSAVVATKLDSSCAILIIMRLGKGVIVMYLLPFLPAARTLREGLFCCMIGNWAIEREKFNYLSFYDCNRATSVNRFDNIFVLLHIVEVSNFGAKEMKHKLYVYVFRIALYSCVALWCIARLFFYNTEWRCSWTILLFVVTAVDPKIYFQYNSGSAFFKLFFALLY